MPIAFKDYYATLEVARDATAEEIKKAFRKLARKHHPDVAKDKKGAEEKFKEINEAHEVLSDPDKRRKYDQLGEHWQDQGSFPPPGQRGRSAATHEFNFGGTGFSDFFEQYFSGASRAGFGQEAFGSTRAAGSRKRRGGDIEGDILVTLEEAMHGSIRPVTLQATDHLTGKPAAREFQVRIPPGDQNNLIELCKIK